MPRLSAVLAAGFSAALSLFAHGAYAAPKTDFSVCWTIYAGWMPWEYGEASGIDSTALIIGVFSNGNDGVVLKGEKKTLGDLKGQNVNLVELSVSHYLLARGLEKAGLREKDLKVINTSDADLVGEGAQSSEAIGMSFAREVVTGDKGNLKLRFDPSYMQMAADGAL